MTRGIAAAVRLIIGWCKKCRRQVDPDPGEMAAAPPIILAGSQRGWTTIRDGPCNSRSYDKNKRRTYNCSRLRKENSIINGNIAENGGSWVYITTPKRYSF